MKLKLLAALLIAASGSPVEAAEGECALHVWPSQSSGAVRAGLLSNLGVAGAYADYEQNKDANMRDQVALIEALTPPMQAQAIAVLDLPTLFGMAGAKLVWEAKPIDPRAARKDRTRLSASAAPCHAELIVTLNQYRNSAVRGVSLKSQFSFKDFRPGRVRMVAGQAASPLRHFPARSAAEQEAAEKDVSVAFADNVRQFARKVARGRR